MERDDSLSWEKISVLISVSITFFFFSFFSFTLAYHESNNYLCREIISARYANSGSQRKYKRALLTRRFSFLRFGQEAGAKQE